MSQYTNNPAFESAFGPPAFPVTTEQSLQLTKDFHWNYADRRSLQEIVPGLFLGPLAAARDLASLQQLGIKNLVAVRTSATMHVFKPRHPEQLKYEAFDIVEGSLLTTLPRVKPYIEAVLSRGEKMLFYDETGNAKAPVLICAYLMEMRSMSSQAAYTFVKSRRLSVSLNEHELYQLQEFETYMKARNSIVAHSYSSHELNRSNRRRKYHDHEDDDSDTRATDERALEEEIDRNGNDYRRTNPFMDIEPAASNNLAGS